MKEMSKKNKRKLQCHLISLNDEKNFIYKCPYRNKKCGDNKEYNFKDLDSYCNQCYLEGVYNIKNGR